MRLKQYINEEYLTRASDRIGNSYEIFMNPSRRDARNIGTDEVRFIASAKTKNVYAFSILLLHHDAWKQLLDEKYEKGTIYYEDIDWLIAGYAKNQGGNLICDDYETEITLEGDNLKYNWKFVDRYIKGFTGMLDDWEEEGR